MKTSYVLSAAFKIVGIVFFLETLISVLSYIPAITIYINSLSRLSNESIPDFSFPIIVVAGFVLLSLSLTTILIIYSDRISKCLVESNDREVGVNPHWNVPDVLFISIQIIATLTVVKGFRYFLENTAKGVCLLFNPDILNEVLDSRIRFEIGSELIAGLLLFIFGVALFFLSHRITNFLDRFNRKGARPNHVFQRDR
jgi:hypothetical protein